MHIAFATCFFLIVGLNETLRQGIFGLNPSESTGMTYGAIAFCALVLLRSDIVWVVRRPDHALYGDTRLNWTWRRTALGVFLGPLIWIVPLAYGFALIQINLNPVSTETLVQVLLMNILLIGLAEELFFREAAVKAFGEDIRAIYVASTLAFFIFYLPGGVPAALTAAGLGMYYTTLRLIGTNILCVAVLHGVTTVAFAQIFALDLTPAEQWPYAIYFFSAAAILSLVIFSLFSQNRSELRYA